MFLWYSSYTPGSLVRLHKRGLTLVGAISDICFDQLIGAGCVTKIGAAWVGNVITGSGYCFRRAVDGGTLDVEDHSNFTHSAGTNGTGIRSIQNQPKSEDHYLPLCIDPQLTITPVPTQAELRKLRQFDPQRF